MQKLRHTLVTASLLAVTALGSDQATEALTTVPAVDLKRYQGG